MNATDRNELKRAAALRAIEEVEDGMVVGLGTGSTAAFVVEGLAARVADGLHVSVSRPPSAPLLRRAGWEFRSRLSPSTSGWISPSTAPTRWP